MRRRPAFSLMELLLVLAVLVAVGAMVYPALQGPMEDQRLRKAADGIRAQWARARVMAMKTGQIYAFRYQVGSGWYGVEPWEAGVSEIELAPEAEQEPTSVSQATVARSQFGPLGTPGVRLPAGITFFTGQTVLDMRSQEVVDGQQNAGLAESSAQSIVFYPDGTSSDATLILTNQRFYVQLHLRGLTGLSRGSDLLAAEELML
jgi:Tfp pilus assembly protein FimT